MGLAFSSQTTQLSHFRTAHRHLCCTCSENKQNSSFLLRDKGYPLWPKHILQNKVQLQKQLLQAFLKHSLRFLHQSCLHKLTAVSVLLRGRCLGQSLIVSQPSWFWYLELLHTATLDHAVGIPFISSGCKDLPWLRGVIIIEQNHRISEVRKDP